MLQNSISYFRVSWMMNRYCRKTTRICSLASGEDSGSVTLPRIGIMTNSHQMPIASLNLKDTYNHRLTNAGITTMKELLRIWNTEELKETLGPRWNNAMWTIRFALEKHG